MPGTMSAATTLEVEGGREERGCGVLSLPHTVYPHTV